MTNIGAIIIYKISSNDNNNNNNVFFFKLLPINNSVWCPVTPVTLFFCFEMWILYKVIFLIITLHSVYGFCNFR